MAKADKALSARRVEDLLRIRLDGAQWWDVREYVREKEGEAGSAWFVAEGEGPLSDGQIRRYQTKADKLILSSHERSRKKLFRRHLAQRRHLYAKAVLAGDYRTALAVAVDEARLQGLYPAERHEHTGKAGGKVELRVVEEVIHRTAPAALGNIVEEVVTSTTRANGTGPDDPPAPGAAGLPPQ
jgi:hypothetical protein